MKKLAVHLFSAVLATVTFAVSHAKADFVPWTYNWARTPVAIAADTPGTGGLTLTDQPLGHAIGSSDIVATNIRTFSSAPRSNPDHFSNRGYTLTLFLQDDKSGASKALVFSGFFSGSLSSNSANIVNTFTGSASQTAALGGHTYTVTIGAYAPPGPPSAANAGSISAHVSVDEFSPGGSGGTGGGGGGGEAPEPSTLLLAGTGLSFLGAAGWRKLKRRSLVRELAYA
ncbi:MAG: PEP-CTERM sorting domain-containing protein [Gemmataceae bacterium]